MPSPVDAGHWTIPLAALSDERKTAAGTVGAEHQRRPPDVEELADLPSTAKCRQIRTFADVCHPHGTPVFAVEIGAGTEVPAGALQVQIDSGRRRCPHPAAYV